MLLVRSLSLPASLDVFLTIPASANEPEEKKQPAVTLKAPVSFSLSELDMYRDYASPSSCNNEFSFPESFGHSFLKLNVASMVALQRSTAALRLLNWFWLMAKKCPRVLSPSRLLVVT